MNVIYLHGFASSGNSSKSDWLHDQFTDSEFEFVSPDLPNNPAQAITFLDDCLGRFADHKVCLIGTSLGGFYAAFYGAKHGWPAVLINPLADVHDLINSAMGENVNFATGESFVMHRADADALIGLSEAMRKPEAATLLLLDKGDELLDYSKAIARFGNESRTHLFDGGSHRFDHLPEAMPEILSLIT